MSKQITFTITAAIAAITLALSGFAVAPIAHAQMTEAELDAEISRLTSIIEQLTGQLNLGSTGGFVSAASVCPYTWTRDLGQGARGPDVLRLQQFLNASPDTQLAVTGAGSPGMETQYYGPITANAVSRFQAKYSSEVLTPIGLFNPTGYFGRMSRAKANNLCVTPVTPPADDDANDDANDDEDDDDFRLRGEGFLDTFEFDDEDDEVEEGEEDVPVATITMEADQGDLELDRMTLRLVADAGNEEDEPWDVFETVSLWVDGDMIAEFEADDEDEYIDEDDGEFRFSNMDFILRENEEEEITIAVSAQNGIDGAGTAATWDISVEEVRVFDADGVASDENNVDEMGDTVTFDIVEEGEGDELEISSSSRDPNSRTFTIEEDEREDFMIFAFELDADNSDNDIELEEVVLRVEGTATGAGLASDDLEEFVRDFYIDIDGDIFDAEDYDGNGNSETITFDIDADYVLDADDRVVVELWGEFDVNSNFESATITAETVSVSGEGADDIEDVETVRGEEHTVITEGIVIPADSVETDEDSSGDNDTTGNFEIEFEVSAFEGDFYIADAASQTANAGTGGVEFAVSSSNGTVNTVAASLTSTADDDTGAFLVEEGETETFTLNVAVTASATGFFRVTLEEVWFSQDTDGLNGEVRLLSPASDYRTGTVLVNQP